MDAFAQSLTPIALAAGDTLFRRGDPVDAVYVVLDGRLDLYDATAGKEAAVLATIGPGEPVGEVQITTGGERGNDVRAAAPTTLGRCAREAFLELIARFDDLRELTRNFREHRLRRNKLRDVLPRLLGSLDEHLLAALEFSGTWRRLSYAEALFREGEPSHSMCILISGRLRVGAPPRFVAEVAPGEAIGEMGLVLDGEPRSETVLAVRESEVLELSRDAFRQIGEAHPALLSALAGLLARRLRAASRQEKGAVARVKNVVLVPLGPDVPIGEVAERLVRGLGRLGSVLHLDRARMNRLLRVADDTELGTQHALNLKIAQVLEHEEQRHDLIVYQAEASATPWTRRCMDQADRVLLVANASDDAEPDASEATLMTQRHAQLLAHSALVLLHPDRGRLPSGTRAWLGWRKVDSHYHVCMDREQDFERLARYVAGRAVGVVLSGGGGRASAHFGVLRALEEAGIPIDMVGGTSGGGTAAIEYGMGKGLPAIVERTRDVLTRIKPFNRFTLPYVSLLSTRKLERVIEENYGDAHLEDLWLPTFCVSCNLATGDEVVHLNGPLKIVGTATAALPIGLPPVVRGRDLLVDGGVAANLPVQAMLDLGAHSIVGSDVSPQDELTFDVVRNRLPTGWQILWHRLMPFRKPLRAPSIGEIILRLVTLNDTKTRNDAWRRCDLLVRPAVDEFGMMQFDAIDEMIERGHADAQRAIEALGEEHPLLRYSPGRAPT